MDLSVRAIAPEQGTAMLKGKTSMELASIATAGGGLEIDGAQYTSMELASIASAAARSNCPQIVVHNADSKTSLELASIAKAGNGKVIFK